MKFLMSLLVAGVLFGVGSASADQLRVVAATNDLAAIANAVGKDLIELDVVARPDRDPHAIEVRPSTMRKTSKADIYLAVGLSLDLWSPEVVRGSRNRDLVFVDCSVVISPLEIPAGKVDASMGDVHPEGNPHYWLDPENGILLAHLVAEQFAILDPSNSDAFFMNAGEFEKEIRRRMPLWDAKLRGQVFLEFHQSWVYLAERFDMKIAGQIEPLPGIPPSARHLARLSELIQETNIPIAVRDHFHDESPLEFLERETGIKTVVLPSACQEPIAESYLSHFDEVAEVLGGESPSANGDSK